MKHKILVILLSLVVVLSCISSIPLVHAIKQIKLVAVSEEGGEIKGSIADLYLETHPGSGRVFMDTFPLTKSDTQLSTRFAKEIACDYLERDCSDKDFFYTIRATSGIIGGPSAGAATALLTIAELEGFDIPQGTAITGTINNGGFIGPVGGVKEKVDGAIAANLTLLLIPMGKRFAKPDADKLIVIATANPANLTNKTVSDLIGNTTLDLFQYVENTSLKLVEVETLDDTLYAITGKHYRTVGGELENNSIYIETMQEIAENLCNRTQELFAKVEPFGYARLRGYNQTLDLYNRSQEAFRENNLYSAASFCFGANVRLNMDILNLTRVNISHLVKLSFNVQEGIFKLNKEIDQRKLETITDLQIFMIVKERLEDAEESNKLVYESRNKTNISLDLMYNLAYANERLLSAKAWAKFFGKPGKALDINQEHIRDSCIKKLAESEERIEYVQLSIPVPLGETIALQKSAEQDYQRGQYALCLYKASRAKAEADAILSWMGVSNEMVNTTLDLKLELARKSIVDQQRKGLFPILAYSYYEYARVLKSDPPSALLYAEYALELSHIDLYFRPLHKRFKLPLQLQLSLNYVYVLIIGALFGIVVGYLIKVKVDQRRALWKKSYLKHNAEHK